MAEQAINTIYLLGEQPDALCSDLLKNLTSRVFANPPSTAEPPSTPRAPSATPIAETPMSQAEENDGDTTVLANPGSLESPNKPRSRSGSTTAPQDTVGSFTLAQLVFVVGHVAIKHIVYLELVEREFKRRKDEKAKGTSYSCGFLRILDNGGQSVAWAETFRDGRR